VTSIVVFGTGGMGREAAAWVADAVGPRSLRGFLDDAEERHGTDVAGLPVLGGVEWLADHPEVEVVPALGAPARRADLLERLDAAGAALATLVHPTAMIGRRVEFAPGVIVCPGVILTCDIEVDRAAILNYGAMVGHDGRIGQAAFLAPGVHLAGTVTVGAEADVGLGAAVIQGVTIGERAAVGAGAVVIRDVLPGTTVVGVPARPLERPGR
jgi:sugar O-acyltransferase (sialic acid O-acetyltransferase NeuD family)